MAMELDVHGSIKRTLKKAKGYYETKENSKAASAYEKAANLISMWAEQAMGREAEQRRKKMAHASWPAKTHRSTSSSSNLVIRIWQPRTSICARSHRSR